ncbi:MULTISPECIES: oligosaccharide MFS transporter [Liquorilactobacillus]|jgi:OHS family lactose permease-like MFS transporter|uniref:MFS transporter n=2 Tax=Liquorilactobacillus nagelii TaxID=82688 RepID=A0A3S6QV73_9LACO|nr:oligosaccharide MFS transporter [Liquorilactobacillus nagelii]AUJ31988.1 MFS transporter [Liquorilactobacillus nagelii]MCC7615132.1 MFS transporter [Liquorilactobacillus nagelii]MCI1921679.1 oligosaccharide MFS transporter [Liquorilactobacillus nagelii]MCI1976289.1 oligosaccharide MFS transporter [Liquorilactobacillus nagelii]MCP9314795.1 oligosaccharide MFS transporter [Liquorilactobacillus nagelii]
MSKIKKALSNPFYLNNSIMILLFFVSWGIWWSFFQIWLTNSLGFSGSQVGTIYSFDSAITLILMLVYGTLQDKLGRKKNLLIFCTVLEIFLGPFFTWIYVPMLKASFFAGALLGSIYLSAAFLAASPTFEALIERMSRRFNFEYGQARAWGSFGYAVAALIAGYLFTINPYLLFWIGSLIAVVLFLVLLFLNPEKNPVNHKFENKTENMHEKNTPSIKDILSVFKMWDVWKIIIFIIFSWTFYTVFDQQMFPEFFTKFFSTSAVGEQAYGILNSIEVFLESIMMGLVPILMKKIGVRKTLLLGIAIMVIRIGGCGLVTNPVGVSFIKLLHAPETAIFILAMFRYFTLHFDTRVSATLYMVGFQIAAQVGQIVFSTPFGALHDRIGYNKTFLIISLIVLLAGIYAFFIIKKDDQDVNGQPLA